MAGLRDRRAVTAPRTDERAFELTDAEKIILDLFGQDAGEGDCLWGGNMTIGFARARAAGIALEDYNRAGEALVLGGYLEKAENNSFRLSKKGLEAKNTGKKEAPAPAAPVTAPAAIVSADPALIEDLG
jgi:hypothetical protein